jgi:hypothetical protein
MATAATTHVFQACSVATKMATVAITGLAPRLFRISPCARVMAKGVRRCWVTMTHQVATHRDFSRLDQSDRMQFYLMFKGYVGWLNCTAAKYHQGLTCAGVTRRGQWN